MGTDEIDSWRIYIEPMYMSIKSKETGDRIRQLLMENGYTVRDVQEVMGFENPHFSIKIFSIIIIFFLRIPQYSIVPVGVKK